MGMFDTIRCHYPLPGVEGLEEDVRKNMSFQTKDLDCLMHEYVISAEGRLLHCEYRVEDHSDPDAEGLQRLAGMCTRIPEGEKDTNFTGVMEIYWSNVVAAGPGIYTSEGEDAHHLEYRLTFIEGKIDKVELLQNTRERAAPSSLLRKHYKAPSTEEVARRRAREAESLVGRTLCVWWGGDTAKPYEVKVMAENDRELVLQKTDGRFEVLDRGFRDTCFFDSPADGQAYKDAREAKWEQERQEFEEAIRPK